MLVAVCKGKYQYTFLTHSWLQAYFFLLHFALLHFADIAFFTNWRFVATLHPASLSVSFFPTAFAHFVFLCHILVNFAILQTFSLLFCLLWWSVIFFFLINLFLAASGLCCCVRAFSSCSERGLLFVTMHGLLIVVASLVAEHVL